MDRRQRREGSHILKFTKDGKFLMQIGALRQATPAATTSSNFGRVAKIWVDPKTNEAYVADGYGNKRVAVLDADTGKMKRYWGAYGNKPDDADLGKYDPKAPPAQQFRNPVHCVERTQRRPCLRVRPRERPRAGVPARRQIREGSSSTRKTRSARARRGTSPSPETRSSASCSSPTGTNEKVRIILRETLEEITNFGDGGRQPGQFYGVHSIATDSKGNLYTTETYEGKRVQKFVYKGIGTVAAGSQGVLWPRAK